MRKSGYKRFKRKIYRGVFAKSLLFSLTAALLLAATVLLLGKLNVIEDNLMLAAVAAATGLVLGFIAVYAILAPGAKRAAKMIDEELSLSEMAQTMQAFRGERGEMIELQREQTEKYLRGLPSSCYSVRRVWVYALCLLLSFALCSFAYVIPDKAVPPPEQPPEEPFELSEWQQIALENLIEYVENSALRDTAKSKTVTELRELLDALADTDTKRQMKELVVGSIVDINGIIDRTNSYDELAELLEDSNAVGISELVAAIGTPSDPVPESGFAQLSLVFAEGSAMELSNKLLGFGAQIGIALTRASLTDDPLADALDALSNGAFDIIDNIAAYDDDTVKTAITELLAAARLSFTAALSEASVNSEVGTYTVARLMEIFGITKDDLPPEVEENLPEQSGDNNDGEEPPEEDEEQKGDSGGFGSGDTLYGSDDAIYYPDEERYAKYGEVINEYYAKITEKILSGELSAELVAELEKYFETLYDGAAREEE